MQRSPGLLAVSHTLSRAAVRSANASIVSDGDLPPPEEGNTLASVIHRLRQRCDRRFGSTTEEAGSMPIRQVPKTCVELKLSQVVDASMISVVPQAARSSRHLVAMKRSRAMSGSLSQEVMRASGMQGNWVKEQIPNPIP